MLFKHFHSALCLLLVFVILSNALKPAQVKKRKPKFLEEREEQLRSRQQLQQQLQLMNTYTVSVSPESSSPAPKLKSSSKADIEILKKIPESKCPRKTKKGDRLKIDYIGLLPDGSQFDSSFKKGKPVEFELGAGAVLPVWDQGLNDMCIGEIRQLSSPADLSGVVGSNANSLIFKVELLEIVGYELPDDIKRDEL